MLGLCRALFAMVPLRRVSFSLRFPTELEAHLADELVLNLDLYVFSFQRYLLLFILTISTFKYMVYIHIHTCQCVCVKDLVV